MYRFGRTGKLSRERGAAAVEFALILPVFLLLVFAIIEFGIAYQRWNTVTHSAREGARRLAVGDDPGDAIISAQGSGGPTLGYPVTCRVLGAAELPDLDSVGMECEAPFEFALWAITKNGTVDSMAIMLKE